YTLLASGVCGAKSVALEPVASTFDILTQNIALNQLHDKVTLKNTAAGAREGTILFSTDEDSTNHVIAANESPGPGSVYVEVITADSLAEDGPPLLAKIDVEGFETEVLNGMGRLLDNNGLKAIIIELNGSGSRYGYDENAIHQLLTDKMFQPYSYDPFSRQLTALSSYGIENTIYCRDIDFITSRLKTAKFIQVKGEVI
ncbi:MAG TPA: FkbM family methyltransferase, partial [Mucilaginibacter sp.]|nr:FkbM family methyltransferase [Mucilaginibacter sp.]